jgi:hypothetical protein
VNSSLPTQNGSSTPVNANPNAAAPSPQPPQPVPPPAPPPQPPTAIDLLADEAVKELDALEAKLDLDIVIRPNDKQQIHSLNRVSVKAVNLAADIVTSDPTRFPDFTDIPGAADYTNAMGRVATRVTELGTHVTKSIQNKRYPTALQVLALYQVIKGLSRLADNETMREKVPELAAELGPRKKKKANPSGTTPPKPKLTVAEKAAKKAAAQRARRVAKAKAVIAANTDPPPATAPAAGGNTSPPAAAANDTAHPAAVTLTLTPAPQKSARTSARAARA